MYQRPEYLEGRKSYHLNEGKFICPYKQPSDKFNLFERGWVQPLKSSDITYNNGEKPFLYDDAKSLRPENYKSRIKAPIPKPISNSKYNAYANRK